jgi:hypothetical protein
VLVAALLTAYPHMSGVVFDTEPVIAGARSRLADAGLTARCRCIAGDFFARVPTGGDVYLLKSVLHNWDDAASVTILRHCRQAMREDARVLVVERVIPLGNSPAEAKLFDIDMLVFVGGRERTEHEYRALFRAAGFRLTRIVPTLSPLSLIEGVSAASG